MIPQSASSSPVRASPLDDMNTNGGEPTLSGAGKLQYTRIQLIPWSSIPMNKPVLNELVERKVKDGDNFQVGRQVHKEVVPGAPPTLEREFNPLDVWFMSKVVSRAHAEFCFKEGQLFVRDIGSSSGTFLNKSRLSPSGKESKNYPLKEGDILQFGVDYKGKPDDIYKSITVRIGFYDQSWVHTQKKKTNPAKFRVALKTLLASTAANSDGKIEEAQDEASANECCVCIGETGAFQALFLAPCSHCFHYKCVSHIIVQSALFQCPLCRQVANLTASVSSEDLPDLGEIAIGALGDKKYFDAPKATSPTSDDLLQVPSPSDGNNSRTSTGDKKNKDKDVKRKSSFTSKLGLFLGRRLSGKEKDKETPTSAPANAGSAGGSGSNNTTSPSAVSALSHIDTNPMTPTSPHQRSSPSAPVAPSQVSAPINPYSNGPHLQFAPDVVVEEVANLNQAEGRGGDDEENDPNYEYASGGGGSSRGNGGIPRSTTMQTMDSHNAETNMVGDELVLAVPEAQNAVNGNSS